MNKFAVALVAAVGFSSIAAQAMPIGSNQTQDSLVVEVAGGCGAGFHRGHYGRCVRNAAVVAPGVVVAPPVVVAPAPLPSSLQRVRMQAGLLTDLRLSLAATFRDCHSYSGSPFYLRDL